MDTSELELHLWGSLVLSWMTLFKSIHQRIRIQPFKKKHEAETTNHYAEQESSISERTIMAMARLLISVDQTSEPFPPNEKGNHKPFKH
jgi:hypothetical protein